LRRLSRNVKFREAWKIAKTVSTESVFKGNLQMSGGMVSMGAQRDPVKFINNARRGVEINKIVTAFLLAFFMGAMPLYFLMGGKTFDIVFADTSIFFVFGLVMLLSYSLLYMTFFVSGEAITVLATLPFSQKDLSRISVLSFLRLLDLPLVAFVFSYPIVFAFVTGSIFGLVMITLFNTANAIIAVFLTFFLARGFYRRIVSLGGSKAKSALRMVLMLIYGLGTFGVFYFIGYIMSWAVQIIPIFAVIARPEYAWVMLIYPFPFGYLTTLVTSVSPSSILLSLTTPQAMLAIVGSTMYVALAYIMYRRGTGVLRQLALGEIEMAAKITPPSGKISLSIGGVFSTIFKKDLKLASRNAAYASFLVMPVLGVIIFAFMTSGSGTIRVQGVLSAVLYSSFFMLFFALSSLWVEGRGVSVLAQLPISTRKVVQAKSLAATALSLTMPATLLILSLFKPLTTFYSIIISMIDVGAIYASALIALTTVCSMFGEGRLPMTTLQGSMLKNILVVVVGSLFAFAPVAVYAVSFMLLFHDSLYSVSAMAIAALIEISLADLISRKALRD
jgi:predicted permease